MINSRILAAGALLMASEALGASAACAQEASLPPRRPGLWDVVTVTQKPEKIPKISARMCIDAATDRELMDFGLKMSKDGCTRYDVRGKGSKWTIQAECALGPIKSLTHTSISGDFQSRVNISIDGTMTGMPGSTGPQPTKMTQESRWISADCPGMKAGDVMLEGGTKINVKDMRQLRKLLPNLQIR
jgi:Protein of unknown function (DUF3617)